MRAPHHSSRRAGSAADALGRSKVALRRRAIAIRDGLPPEQRRAMSAAIRERLQGLACWKEARAVGLYAAIRGEVDTLPLIEAARAAEKRVAFPRARRSEGTLAFYEVACAADLSLGAFGVPEPAEDDSRRLPIVPGVAFDRRGWRLGFGGGFYDRLLGACRRPSVGLAYACQIHDALPAEDHDRGVDIVVTETGWFKAGGSWQREG
jgi:5-formyltetrahydrofolate cyclo-ligase